ncbi:hypothetical protein CC85DRAFT_288744 [Cutaneotrichosporon oleaginosum]|uniref:Cyclase n=1 Tax=Cutaneotrichosporon oleaginosum TaxID=879819 RepID=A0A0J1AVE1_9TREE|nr:uncharacterized protein CC85DRAFT_288744 [Cutaneotrichosporon oleaginosum]KLT39259.1 hypothetical protein CC85DRAFT_288744 [Cutaneotrichosporon oleaginosum]TXT09621.1 hypothetical protein COLE_03555 [Cutaneotrichosporon oleaginosum]
MPQPCSFDDLKNRSGPPLNSWGLWGEDNELGQLNLIDAAAVKRGRDAVKHGIPVCLNLPMKGRPINPGRGTIQHELLHKNNHFDDKVTFNTQYSTQWDGFAHVPYQNYPEAGKYTYHGGLTHDDILGGCTKFGIHNLAKHPVTTRAHLLDIARWADKHGVKLDHLSTNTPITLDMIQKCAAETGVTFESGDVLIIRTGFTEAVYNLPEDKYKDYDPMKGAIGVEPSPELMRWVWETGIPAVASDAFAFEAWPPKARGPITPCVHEVFLGGWGLPLGELFDLRELSEKCAELNQYTFFLTTMALNIEGGVGSPPNAQAIL